MRRIRPISAALILLACTAARGVETVALDTLRFGDAASEKAHAFAADRAESVVGGLDQSARRVLPREPAQPYGGSLSFTARCDPEKPTYVTVKFWGGDTAREQSRLLLIVDGKQLGARHLGDIDILDIMAAEPRFPGRFVYKTLPLPRQITAGRNSIPLEIRGLGRIWGYGTSWEQFQRPFDQPSRGIYAVYTHTDPCFTPPASEPQGKPPAEIPVRSSPGPETMDKLKARVNGELTKLMAGKGALKQVEMQFLARAYHTPWTVAHHNPAVVSRVLRSLDAFYLAYVETPRLAEADPATWNADWFGAGLCGQVLDLLKTELAASLDAPVETAVPAISRRDAYTKLLLHCRDWHRQHRRLYTNQSMINDLYGIYFANRGLAVCAPAKALPEPAARRYLYESVGLEPWLGSEDAKGTPSRSQGDRFFQLTSKGLTRELGFVGSYGEVLDWCTAIHDATRPAPQQEGDPRIKGQLVKIAQARAVFRHPTVDADGYRAMALETTIGWRDTQFPGYLTYAQRATWDAGPFEAAAATRDPALVGYAQQMLGDHQFFAAVDAQLKTSGFRITAGLLATPEEFAQVAALPPSSVRLPMTPGQPDFVFSDEEDGVVAIKNGEDILYASLYWRARYGLNGLARVHHLTPTLERDVTACEEFQFDDSGLRFKNPGRNVEAHTSRYVAEAADLKNAQEGELQPIAKLPPDLANTFKPGQESIYAGKATFYVLRYGAYTIGMNTTTDRSFTLAAPGNATLQLPVRKPVAAGAKLDVSPRSTVVLFEAPPAGGH